jgi:hypothetical protein
MAGNIAGSPAIYGAVGVHSKIVECRSVGWIECSQLTGRPNEALHVSHIEDHGEWPAHVASLR